MDFALECERRNDPREIGRRPDLVLVPPSQSRSPLVGQLDGSPGRRGSRDELVRAVRKTSFEIWLKGECPGLHEPSTVVQLSPQQKPNAALVGGIGRRQAALV